MIQRKNGVTLREIIEKMRWQRHTIRGFMAGAMKRAASTSSIACTAPFKLVLPLCKFFPKAFCDARILLSKFSLFVRT
jgi:hypothetical protein